MKSTSHEGEARGRPAGLLPFCIRGGFISTSGRVVQSDKENRRLRNTIVVQITSNLKRSKEATHLLIEVASPEGVQSGLLHDSLVSCINLATIQEDRINKVIGSLPSAAMHKINTA